MRWLVVALTFAACSDPSSSPAIDAPLVDAPGKDAACAATFGDALTNAFGRLDGTVVAVVEPGNPTCAMPNRDHLVVQVEMGGAVYRMVVNVQSTSGDPKIRLRTITDPPPEPAFAPGWHTGVQLDYATQLGLHSTDAAWESLTLAEATAHISAAIVVGAPISVYATSSGGTFAHSTHLIHRNRPGADGALVIDPTGGATTWLLLSFADQTF